jgi:hypothetical protein
MYLIVRVDHRRAEQLEPLGTKPKFWYRADDGTRTLFKAEERGTGEDWAEKIVCEFAELLGLPHVHYDLAVDVEREIPGVVCATCAPAPMAMGLGNQLLQALDPEYPMGSKYKVRAHTIDAVIAIVEVLQAPPAPFRECLPAGINLALGVFAGYVMLDALVANQDRHHENWAALRTPAEPRTLYLAPTFDHGASLARNISDEERQERLNSSDHGRQLPVFAARARSAFYESPTETRPLTTLTAWQAFSQRSPGAGTIWLEQLGRITAEAIDGILGEIPPQRMSQISRDFTRELLLENLRRLLAEGNN